MKKSSYAIDTFNFYPGRILAKKYEVISKLGEGWEGEVYLVREQITGIERAAKFFYPQRNLNNKSFIYYAQKLHLLAHCDILIKYVTQESITYRGMPIIFMVSEYVEGELLSEFLLRQPGKRLQECQALLLLHSMAKGIETIHHQREYHGDLHTDNIIIKRYGIGFNVKLLDMYHWGAPSKANIHKDVCDLVRIFYDALGGQKNYTRLSPEIKSIICGLKQSLILKKFRSAGQLCSYLENIQWQ